MKKFYLHDGTEQKGPFDSADLKIRNITKETPIWFEGLTEWTTAGKVDELKEIFHKTSPPPFVSKEKATVSAQKPIEGESAKKQSKQKNTLGVILQSIGAFGAIAVIVMIVLNYVNKDSSAPAPQTYEEKVMTVEEIERSQPTKFLTADGNYNENFWGDAIKVHGVIKNIATVAAYKDAVVRVTYYSKTKTNLGSKEYTIYDNFPPHSEVKFELKIENYKDVNSIGWDVIQAIAN